MKLIKGLIVILALSLVSCKSGESSSNAPRKVKYESIVLTDDDMESCTFSGKVVAATDVNLGFRVAGIIDNICVKDGAYVSKGAVIARLDKRDYKLQLAATQAEYNAIKSEADRVIALYADQSVSENDYDKATNGLTAITSKLEAHKNALADTDLRAPFSGYIQRSNFARGEAVAAGTPVISMISSSAPEITIDIPVTHYIRRDSLKGATATIELFPDNKFNLSLKSISPKANLNQLHRATFTLEPSEGVVPSAGMSASVELRFSTLGEKSAIIPFTAITEQEGKPSVWVITDGKVASRNVEIEEIQKSGKAVISSGVEHGEMIVTAGANSLKEGQEVMLLEESAVSNVGCLK